MRRGQEASGFELCDATNFSVLVRREGDGWEERKAHEANASGVAGELTQAANIRGMCFARLFYTSDAKQERDARMRTKRADASDKKA